MAPRRRLFPVGLVLVSILVAAPGGAQDDGDLDSRWGTSGFARVPNGGTDPTGLACGSNGRCWVGVMTPPPNGFYLYAFTAAGAYHHEGFADFDLGAGDDQAHDIAVGSDGRPVLAGTVQDATVERQFGVARFVDATSLEPDDAFATDGTTTMNFFGDVQVQGVAVGPSGEVFAVGCYQTGGAAGLDFAVVKFLASGLPDNSFDGNGVRTIDFNLASGSDDDCASAVAILPDGKIVVAGFAQHNGDDRDFAVARLTTTGGLDLTFDGDGLQTVAFDRGGPDIDEASDVAVDRFGRVVLAGRATGVSFYRPVLARLTAAGAPDSSFDGEGEAVGKFIGEEGALAQVVGVELSSYPSDRIFFLTKDRFLWALTETGGFDPTFDDNGVVQVTDPTASAHGEPVDLTLFGGMPVVLGAATISAELHDIVARYWVDQIFGDDFESGNTNGWRGW